MCKMEKIKQRLIEKEMKESYVDYAMSVIVGRALPDARDGLKPVHRRILYAMHQLGLVHNKPFKKSARVVGEVLGKFHPHGDAAVYDAMVRMAQDFSLRYPLVNGHGNFGSIDGDAPAAQRYTEVRMDAKAEEMLLDIDKDTVDFQPNFDGSLQEPVVLPSKLPNLIINGSTGIAVGMATNIPPHNLKEIAHALIFLIENPDAECADLMEIVKGPDFPTGGIILGRGGISKAYLTGSGKIKVRGKVDIEEHGNKKRIIVTEIPFMVNKTSLIEGIAKLVGEKRITGISDIRDESDRKGMRIVFELKSDANPDIVINQLYKNSQLQTTFGINMLALHHNQPKVMGLKDILSCFIKHRKEVVTRRARYELKKAEERAHILEGLLAALKNIDLAIKLIKSSKTPQDAKSKLMHNFSLTEVQAQAILDMKLQRLTSLEHEKIASEHKNLLEKIAELKDILKSEKKILDIIKKETAEIMDKYGDERKTEITESVEDIDEEDIIPRANVVVTLTHSGYVKRMPVDAYKTQKRGGRGVRGTGLKEEDALAQVFTTSTHDFILIFTNKGKVYWLKAYKIPEGSRYSRGKAIVNLLHLGKGEVVNTMIPIRQFDDKHYILMITKKGILKKTALSDY
ncbi:MAG: DNA gyrase subunit A [Candidatus Aenigmatarchaeota archaeon]|nr:MAG: DNA gyrase subunit A [Candidatus Aenigmarchaeota archaeon]